MKMLAVVSLAFALLGAAEPLSTDRHVHGVITSVDPGVVTIASSQRTVTGKIDPARTKVTVNGKPAKLGDLKITAHAKAELCLDDVWVAIDTH
jgi:hypothetical protein